MSPTHNHQEEQEMKDVAILIEEATTIEEFRNIAKELGCDHTEELDLAEILDWFELTFGYVAA